MEDFSGSPVIKNLSSNIGDAGSTPGWGTKTPHAAGQWGPHATPLSPCTTSREKPAHHNERSACRNLRLDAAKN